MNFIDGGAGIRWRSVCRCQKLSLVVHPYSTSKCDVICEFLVPVSRQQPPSPMTSLPGVMWYLASPIITRASR